MLLPAPLLASLPAPERVSKGSSMWAAWLALGVLLGLLLCSAIRLLMPAGPSSTASAPASLPAPVPAPAPVPQPAPAPSKVVVEKGRLRTLEKVFFDTDKDSAVAESLPILDQVYEVLQANPDIKKLRIEAHTDNASSEAYNQDLSTRRASWVRQYLIQKGIAAERLESAGFGLSRPIDTNATSEGRANNRRVEFVIVE
jgi:outer membrane protein OmpA-like peptidoglycan-associated protein